MKLKIAYFGDPILRQKAAPVGTITDEIRNLIKQMFEVMTLEDGIGLAAPQVHHSLRIFIMQVPFQNEDETWNPGTRHVFVDPTILSFSDELTVHEEGCLSIPNVYGDVERPIAVSVEAFDETGKKFTATYHGLEARCILHENDHINGKLFIDRMSKNDRKNIDKALREIKKKHHG